MSDAFSKNDEAGKSSNEVTLARREICGKVLDALVEMSTEDLPTLEEADEDLRAAGYDPRELSRGIIERLKREGLLT